jgi:hypothetical protein
VAVMPGTVAGDRERGIVSEDAGEPSLGVDIGTGKPRGVLVRPSRSDVLYVIDSRAARGRKGGVA